MWTPGEAARIGSYVLRRCLGRGGHGQVWLAWKDNPTGRRLPCVIKFPLHKYINDPQAVQQFLDEGGMAMAMNNHANTIRVTDVGMFKGMPYIVMEYIDGASLAKLMNHARSRHRRVALPAIYHILASVASALHHAHYGAREDDQPVKLVHRDVKPGNVLINRDGLVKLTDFGISAFLDDDESGVHIRGTDRYMSPEHVRAKVQPEMDIYALGIIGWELLENRVYRVECNGNEHYQKILDGDIPPMYSTDIPEALTELLLRCLHVNPRTRPLAQEFVKELKNCEGYSRDPDEVARELDEMLGPRRPSGTTVGNAAATPELIATLAVLDGHARDFDPEIDPSDPTPPEPEVDPSALTIERRESELGGAEQAEPPRPVSATQQLGPPVHLMRHADAPAMRPAVAFEKSRTEKIPASSPSQPPREGRRRPIGMAMLAVGALSSVATALVLMSSLGEESSSRNATPTIATVAGEERDPIPAPANENASTEALPTDAPTPMAGQVAPRAPTTRAAEAPALARPPDDGVVAESTPAEPEAPSASTDPAQTSASTKAGPTAKREAPKPTVRVKIVLDLDPGVPGSVRIAGRTVKVERLGSEVKVPEGRHRVRWRVGDGKTWQDAGQHGFGRGHFYLIRVASTALRVIEVE